jgi:hypothetical protein
MFTAVFTWKELGIEYKLHPRQMISDPKSEPRDSQIGREKYIRSAKTLRIVKINLSMAHIINECVIYTFTHLSVAEINLLLTKAIIVDANTFIHIPLNLVSKLYNRDEVPMELCILNLKGTWKSVHENNQMPTLFTLENQGHLSWCHYIAHCIGVH